MENNKMTAVELLVKELIDNDDLKQHWRSEQVYKKALQMEKEQIIESCNAGLSGVPRSAEQYYKQTYGKIYIEKPFDQQNGSY